MERMKMLTVTMVLGLVIATGCVSNSEMKAKERAAFLAGQKQGEAAHANTESVWIVGNVRNPSIPWTEDLTLRKALVEADYQGAGDPSEIVLLRNGKPPQRIHTNQVLNGYDIPLQAGDRVEVRQ